MPTFITLLNFTDQGAKNIKDSPARLNAFAEMAKSMGITVKGAYYTMGQYDMVIIIEGPQDAATAAMVKVSSLGNIRGQTLLAHSAGEMREIIDKVMG
ncbi:MAG: GYD domain-containing protein [Thiotrichales bacterium]